MTADEMFANEGYEKSVKNGNVIYTNSMCGNEIAVLTDIKGNVRFLSMYQGGEPSSLTKNEILACAQLIREREE